MSIEVLESFVGEMTVSELCGRTGRSVDELLAFCTGSQRPSAPVAATVVEKAPRKRANSADLAGLDERVMKLLKRNGKGRGGRELADATKTTPTQLRSSLKRLIAAGQARFAGQTAARRYWAT
ncbi:MAG: hypothetical protein ACRBN8_43165 [Nannocystales bacterium]